MRTKMVMTATHGGADCNDSNSAVSPAARSSGTTVSIKTVAAVRTTMPTWTAMTATSTVKDCNDSNAGCFHARYRL